jgi:glycosyltransferase involved in cell wall biosynthesis
MSRSPVTVVMPVYNAAPYLRAALESVFRQTHADFTLLAIDDGSTDESPAILRACPDRRLRIVPQLHQGVAAAMRTALDLADTELIARADADDVYHPQRLARQVAFLGAHPEVAIVGAAGRRLGHRLGGPVGAPRIRWTALYRSPLANTTIMFRRAAALAVGGYPHDHVYLDDYPFVSRLIDRFAAENLSDVLVTVTVHEDSISRRFSSEAIAEADRVRRANLKRLVGRDDAVAGLFYLLAGGAPPSGFAPEQVASLLEELIARFHERYGRAPGLDRWIARQLYERALLHGDAPPVLARMLGLALRLNGRLVLDPRVVLALFRHLVLRRRGPAPR